ncbi:hypothetical protein GCM10027610_126640 [Dactylosporangium cerinum]
MPSVENPNTAPITYEYVPPSRPANSSAVARVPVSIGTTWTICCQRDGGTGGISGGAWTTRSPLGISGAGRRGDRFMMTVLTPETVSPAQSTRDP